MQRGSVTLWHRTTCFFGADAPAGPRSVELRPIVHAEHVFGPVGERGGGGEARRRPLPLEDVAKAGQDQAGVDAAQQERCGDGGVEPAAESGAAGCVVVEKVASVVGGVDTIREARLGSARQRRQEQASERRVLDAGPTLAARRGSENEGDDRGGLWRVGGSGLG